MIRVNQVKLPVSHSEADLRKKTAKMMGVSADQIQSVELVRQSLDARKKPDLYYLYALDVAVAGKEAAIVKRARSVNVQIRKEEAYRLPDPGIEPLRERPVIVGFGPAGMFCGLMLARAGYRPLILERGLDADSRAKAVARYWTDGALDPECNVQFGEGGAGTFSDGKLTTGIKSPFIRQVLQELYEAGAPEEILYAAKPHIGTDRLAVVVQNIRKKIERLGGEVRLECRLENLILANGFIHGVTYSHLGQTVDMETDAVILAIGHSARDTVEMLYKNGAQIIQKPFSVGARIEHPQKLIDKAQYGAKLGAADYKLSCHGLHQRGAYTFCMCPGGTVVAAASEKGGVIVNGMSTLARDGENANSALLVGIDPVDFPSEHPLAGMYYQREIEQNAFALGGGDYRAPAQLVGDFLADRESRALGNVQPTCPTGVTLTNLRYCLPDKVRTTMQAAITEMDKRLHGFALPDAVLTAPETRSSSSVRM